MFSQPMRLSVETALAPESVGSAGSLFELQAVAPDASARNASATALVRMGDSLPRGSNARISGGLRAPTPGGFIRRRLSVAKTPAPARCVNGLALFCAG